MSGKHALLAPGAPSSGVSARLPGRDDRLPAVYERAVEPETRQEMLGGVVSETMGATAPHAIINSRVAFVLSAAVADGFVCAVDLMTRTDQDGDFAPDVSIFPAPRDEKEDERELEHIAFEVRDTQGLAKLTAKAAALSARGVRRIIRLDVKRERVFEFDPALGDWAMVDARGSLEDDTCLVQAVSWSSLLKAANADNAVAEAMVIKQPEPIKRLVKSSREAGHADGRKEGHADGLKEGIDKGRADGLKAGLEQGQLLEARKSLRRVLSRRGFTLTPAQEALIDGCGDLAELERWLDNAITAPSADEALALSSMAGALYPDSPGRAIFAKSLSVVRRASPSALVPPGRQPGRHLLDTASLFAAHRPALPPGLACRPRALAWSPPAMSPIRARTDLSRQPCPRALS